MKVVIANKFHYRRGGDCVYSINLEQLLSEKGHKVATFSMQHPENIIDSGICSVCHSDIIHSYRIEKQNYNTETAIIELI